MHLFAHFFSVQVHSSHLMTWCWHFTACINKRQRVNVPKQNHGAGIL